MDGARWTFDGKPVRWSWMHREAARAMGMRAGFISEDELVEIRTTDPQSGEEVTIKIWPDFESDALISMWVGTQEPGDLWAVKRDPKKAFAKFLAWVEAEFGEGLQSDTDPKKGEAIRVFMHILAGVKASDFDLANRGDREDALALADEPRDQTGPAAIMGGDGGEADDPFGSP